MTKRLHGNGPALKIDKTRFLVLTSMISAAAVACTIQNTKKDDPASASTPTTTTDGGGGTTADGGSTNDSDGSTAQATDGGEAGVACIADDGDAPTCASSKCPAECETVAARFKKAIARQIVGCMDLYPSCESITSCVAERTADNQDGGVAICADPTAATFCQPLVDSCKDNGGEEITQASCEAIVKTLTATGRDQFTSCITEGTAGYCTYGSSWCIDAMRY